MKRHDSPPIRRSIEVEYWVIDDEGRLSRPGALMDASPGLDREFVEPILEIKTSPCDTATELRDEFLGRIRSVLRRANDLNKGLVPLGTPIHSGSIRERPGDRTRIQNLVIGDSFEYVRHCAGTHMHFEQQPGATIDQLNTLIALDPAFALLNSARHFRGEPRVPGIRSQLYRRWAYDDIPNQGELWSYVADRADWTERVTDCYEEFVSRAAAADVDQERIESCFDPDTPECAVWAPVKLREVFGTVEWRSPDATLPSEILRLSETMASIVARVREADVSIGNGPGRIGNDIVLPDFDTVVDHINEAIQDGLSSSSLCSYLTRMGFDVEAYAPLTDTFDPDRSFTRREARAVRLEYAERLREDVLHPELAG